MELLYTVHVFEDLTSLYMSGGQFLTSQVRSVAKLTVFPPVAESHAISKQSAKSVTTPWNWMSSHEE